jgi:hypothetical protein
MLFIFENNEKKLTPIDYSFTTVKGGVEKKCCANHL